MSDSKTIHNLPADILERILPLCSTVKLERMEAAIVWSFQMPNGYRVSAVWWTSSVDSCWEVAFHTRNRWGCAPLGFSAEDDPWPCFNARDVLLACFAVAGLPQAPECAPSEEEVPKLDPSEEEEEEEEEEED